MSADNNTTNSNNKNTGTTTSSGASRSSNATADSYIGSVISLTSKSEIRYEGVLYNINTDESSIGLENVRSFGTEGRRKDGPQIPPSDRVYEYILFRGSDIKDLQVKSSPPAQHTPPINNDPAIIQSQYSRPFPSSTGLPSSGSGSLSDFGSHNAQMGMPGSNFQVGLPLYQPGGSFGTWGASPSAPSANGSGFPMPMYWQGYYGPSSGLPNMHQQSLLRPPPGLSIPPAMQQPVQDPNFNTPLLAGASNPTASNLPVASLTLTVPDNTPPLLSASTNSFNLASTSSAPLLFPSSLTPVPSSTVASETLQCLMPTKAPTMSLPAVNPTTSLPLLSSLTTSGPELNAIVPPVLNKPNVISGPTMPYQGIPQSSSSAGVASVSLQMETPTPSLVTPGQLLQAGPTALPSSQLAQVAHIDVEVVQVSSSSLPASEPLIPVPTEAQPPLLPLPVPSSTAHKLNGAPSGNPLNGYRGSVRGRGFGNSHHVTKFTEDFDFEAMNEKFNKDEVWGHLGKSNKSHSKDREYGKLNDEDYYEDECDDDVAKIEIKSMYNKDDFFDTLSCNTLDHGPQNGRTRFSEQMKLDTETFGNFSWHRGGRGGRGPPRGGRFRGSYYGRGYGYGGYGGYGRGQGMHSRSS